MNNALDIGSNLSTGWETFTKNAVAMILGLFLVALVGGVSLGICLGPLILGYNRMVLRAVRGEQVSPGDVFSGFDKFGPAFVLMLLMGLAIGVGFMLLFIPGLILGYLFYWSFWFMAAGEDSAVECMKKSSALARADVGSGIVFVLVNGVIQGAGNAIPFGGLITGPVAMGMAGSGFLNATQPPQAVDQYGQPMGQQGMQVQQQYGSPQ
ncbi:MAG: hypothetical protein KC457_24245 [Myxococcales bacterium]|nr:hypothetical protein [Myxococcales bacterium]